MMGAAYRAKFALLKNESTYEDILKSLPEPTIVCEPYDDADTVSKNVKYLNKKIGIKTFLNSIEFQIYKPMVLRYRNIIEQLVENP